MPLKKQPKTKYHGLNDFLPLLLLMLFFALAALFWNNISWIANPNVWRQTMTDVFPQLFPRPYILAVKNPAIISVTPKIDNKLEIKSAASTTPKSTKKPRHDLITIPKINITAPIISAMTDDAAVIYGLLDSGVVLYPGSVAFGKSGQSVILGHSAPAGWPKIKYDWVFSKLDELTKGDMIVITYNYETRYYKVVGTQVVSAQNGVPRATVTGNSLMLISCWPPGKDTKRIAVEAATTSSH